MAEALERGGRPVSAVDVEEMNQSLGGGLK